MNKRKIFQNYSWILFIIFISASIYDIKFGSFGVLCMFSPIFFSSVGKGKIHCSLLCPRGSFLGKFLDRFSIGFNIPPLFRNKLFKNSILSIMLTIFTLSLYKGGLSFENIGSTIFTIVMVTTLVGILLGIIYSPRVWCIICPMGHASELIDKRVRYRK